MIIFIKHVIVTSDRKAIYAMSKPVNAIATIITRARRVASVPLVTLTRHIVKNVNATVLVIRVHWKAYAIRVDLTQPVFIAKDVSQAFTAHHCMVYHARRVHVRV